MADIGWISLASADTYFSTRYNNAEWTVLTNAQKTAALTTAYDRIRYCSEFNIPASPTVAQKSVLADAQCEMSFYIIIHLADEDRRKGLQAQGVSGAGIVKETYEKDWMNKLPIPPIVYEILSDIYKYASSFAIMDIDRDEDKGVDEDVVD